MGLSYTVVSIGALSRNRFWGETEPRRPAHATTTLVRDENTLILVDPALPDTVLAQRLDERTGLQPGRIDVVFLTSFRPVHRRGLGLFPDATWVMYELEIEAVREHLDQLSSSLGHSPAGPGGSHGVEQSEVGELIGQERAILKRIGKADDKLTRRVHLFPSTGVTPGSAGLLLTEASRTVAIVGDAVISRDYFEAGRVYEQVYDLEAAQGSFRDVVEIADLVIPGHDNLFVVAGK